MRGRCNGENGRGRWWSATTSATRTVRREGKGRWAVLVERKQGGKGDRKAAVDDQGRRGRSGAAAEEKGRGGRKERRWTAVDPAMAAVLAMEKEAVAERGQWRSRRGGGRSQRGEVAVEVKLEGWRCTDEEAMENGREGGAGQVEDGGDPNLGTAATPVAEMREVGVGARRRGGDKKRKNREKKEGRRDHGW